jgi:hypothetical protein
LWWASALTCAPKRLLVAVPDVPPGVVEVGGVVPDVPPDVVEVVVVDPPVEPVVVDAAPAVV